MSPVAQHLNNSQYLRSIGVLGDGSGELAVGWSWGSGRGRLKGVNTLETLVGNWLTLPDVAEALDLSITKVHGLINERALVSVRVTDRGIRSVPAEFITDGHVLESLKGTVAVLGDSGFSDEEIIRWLFSEDESLPGRPIDALKEGRKTEIRRRAQAMAW